MVFGGAAGTGSTGSARDAAGLKDRIAVLSVRAAVGVIRNLQSAIDRLAQRLQRAERCLFGIGLGKAGGHGYPARRALSVWLGSSSPAR